MNASAQGDNYEWIMKYSKYPAHFVPGELSVSLEATADYLTYNLDFAAKLDLYQFSADPNAVELLKLCPHLIRWETIGVNPNPAVLELLRKRPEYIETLAWVCLATHEWAHDFIMENADMINDKIIEYLKYEYIEDIPAKDHLIWHLLRCPNIRGISDAEVKAAEISDAETKAAGIIADAETKAAGIIAEAEAKADRMFLIACKAADRRTKEAEQNAAQINADAEKEAAKMFLSTCETVQQMKKKAKQKVEKANRMMQEAEQKVK